MTSTFRSPEGLDLDGLSAFLDAQLISTSGQLRASLVSGGKSNLTFRVGDDIHRWILRRPPMGVVEHGAHDVSREYRVMHALADSLVPVPRVVALCDDPGYIGAPFYLMNEVQGSVYRHREQVEPLDISSRRAMSESLIDTLADLHDIVPTEVGLSALGRPDGYLERQLDRWRRQYHALDFRSLPAVDQVISTLQQTIPSSPGASIVHGDYRIDNVIIDTGGTDRVCAVLDWEMATLGDPLADLATLVMFWDEPGGAFNPITGGLTAFEGFYDKSGVVERYVTRRGIDSAGLDWYLCLAEVRLAVILEQINVRHSAGQTLGEGFAGMDDKVDTLLVSATKSAAHLVADPTR